MPAWIERWDPRRSVEDNLLDLILRKGAPLREEPRFLLMEELRDPRVYFSLCRAVAFGATSPNEIAQSAGLSDRGVTSRYLDTLRNLRVLERHVPVTERNPERTRRGHYRLTDPLFRFWFRFVLPNTSALEGGDPETVLRTRVLPHLDQHVSPAFEDAARQHLWRLVRAGRAPAPYERVGSWWRMAAEVDVVALSEADSALLLGEVKWSRNPVGLDILERLVARTPAVVADLACPPADVRYALWSRSGFTPDLVHRAQADGVLLFTTEDVTAG
jgi:AAA+ ATPase superfamily predicted ATPase